MAKRTRKPTRRRKEKPDAAAPEKAGQLSVSADDSGAKWRPAYVKICAKMALGGATDREMADALGVAVRNFHRWKIAYPALAAALKLGKTVPDDNVERSLYNRAMGYSFEAEELFVDRLGQEHRMPCVKHIPPDVTACIFYLKNRRPDEWRDRQEIHHTLTSADDLRAARERARQSLDRSVVAEQSRAA